MEATTLDAHLAAPVEVDICAECQAFWFDKYESLKLSPGSTLKLMKLIGEHTAPSKELSAADLKCPRCLGTLRTTNDMQRSTRFSYWRCGNEHGRFIRFFEFLKEKNFIRPLSPQQLTELRQNMQTVNYCNCGAPIDLVKSSSCAHCGSAISMLDMKQPELLLKQLKATDARTLEGPQPLQLPLERNDREWWNDASSSGLVQAGLGAVARWLVKFDF